MCHFQIVETSDGKLQEKFILCQLVCIKRKIQAGGKYEE